VEEADRELVVVPRGAHRHRDRAAPDTYLERLLDRELVALGCSSRQAKDVDPRRGLRWDAHGAKRNPQITRTS
jgi:hypothetical protein